MAVSVQRTHNKYFHRAPRFVLLPQDNCIICLSGPKQIPWEEGTELLDYSQSGLAFTSPIYISPNVGDYIQIQIKAKGLTQNPSPCQAQVVRVEKYQEDKVLVGVKFAAQNAFQQYLLRQGMEEVAHKILRKTQLRKKLIPIQVLALVFLCISLFSTGILLFLMYALIIHFHWGELGYWFAQIFF